ncbi:MAG: hypothetical protein K2I71_03070, partial [Helicobacter sp.]|nr:hypothetical protein [Helicobacter sp.]
YVAAPLIGSCVGVGAIEQLVMKTYLDNNVKENTKDKDWLTSQTFELFKKFGKKVVENGVVVEKDSENIKKIKAVVKEFMEKLPIYKALGVID